MSFRGVVLEGGYQLGDMIAADSQFAAFRVRVLGAASLDAIAQFYACDPAKADEQLAVWKTIQELAHPNLHTPLAIGKRDVDGCATLYVVLKRVEERLSGALEERTLRPSEASELVTSLHHALEALTSAVWFTAAFPPSMCWPPKPPFCSLPNVYVPLGPNPNLRPFSRST